MSEIMSPTTVNQTLTAADTEYSVSLAGIKHFSMQARGSADVRFAFATGKVAASTSPFATMKAGSNWSTPEKTCFDGTLYLASPVAGVVVEIVYWR